MAKKNSNKKNKYNPNTLIGILAVLAVIIVISNINTKKPGSNPSSAEDPVTINIPEQTEQPLPEGYYLEFNDEFNTAKANMDDLGLSIAIAVDCSGSMAELPTGSTDGKKKYQVASESLTEIITFLQNFYEKNVKGQGLVLKVALLRFSTKVDELYPLNEMNKENFDKLKTITSNIANFTPTSNTAIGDTLKTGAEILSQSGTIFKSLIVITDGKNTIGDEPSDVLDAIVNNKNNKTTRDFPVLTNSILVSFIGFDIDSSIFENLHQIGSRLSSASNKQELNQNLQNLFIADITRLEAK